jgi:hypothetical protein
MSQQATTCHSHVGHHEVKDKVFVPLVPVSLDNVKLLITTATAGVDEDMLTRVWQEFDYRIDICGVTKGAHIEHL